MRIKKFKIKHKLDSNYQVFNFNESINFFHSKKNSVGKTTFVRAILYSFGFKIPSTKKVDFSNYYFELVIENNGVERIINRFCDEMTIDGEKFILQDDFFIINKIFEVSNLQILENLLAIMYVDQEKGWTLLNRGKIIGENHFSIDSFLRGLNDVSVNDLLTKLKRINSEISRYELFYNVGIRQEEIAKENSDFDLLDHEKEIDDAILTNEIKLSRLTENKKRLNSILINNNEVLDYIERLKLQVSYNNDTVFINKNNVVGFNDIQEITKIRLNEINYNIECIKMKIADLKSQKKPKTLFEVDNILKQFEKKIRNIKIDMHTIEQIIKDLKGSRQKINKLIKEQSISNNDWTTKLANYVKKYWLELNIDMKFDASLIYTHDLKSYSGAVLYKMIMAFRFGYIKVYEEKFGQKLMIFIDSPNGREVHAETIDCIMRIIRRDFSENQVFICSIFEYPSLEIPKSEYIEFDDKYYFDRKDSLFTI